MLPSNTEKKNLIEAMKKLTYQISNNPQRQKQIFDSLGSSDLIKIVQNLYDENQYLRRISALLLCELFYNNATIKAALIQKLSLPLQYGRICLNRIPDSTQKTPSDVRKCLELMKSPLRKGQDGMFCWAINLDKKHFDLEFFEFKKYSSFTFLDPQRTVFGFTLFDADHEHQIPQSPATQIIDKSYKIQRRDTSQDSRIDSQISQKRYSITKKIQTIRPATSITSRQKQYISSSKQKTYGFLKYPQQSTSVSSNNPSNPTLNNTGKQKFGTSIQSISQYARNSYGRQNTDRLKQKERFSLSFQNDPGFDSTKLATDRLETRKSTQIQSSTNTTRLNSKTPQNHHQNFYKRVQEILRK